MANEQRTKFNFIKSLLNLKIEDIVNTPNKTVKVGSQSKTISEWCIETRLTLSNDVENIRKQLSNINLPNELLKCLPQFNELSRRVKQDTSINNTSLFQEKIFDAFVVSRMTPDLCMLLSRDDSDNNSRATIQLATAIQKWAYKLLYTYTCIVSKIVYAPTFLNNNSNSNNNNNLNQGNIALLKESMVGFNSISIILESIKNYLEFSATEQGDAALEQARSGLEQLNAWYDITYLLHKFTKVSYWLSSNSSNNNNNNNLSTTTTTTTNNNSSSNTGLSYNTESLYNQRFTRRIKARDEAKSFIGGTIRHDMVVADTSNSNSDIRLFIDELLLVLDKDSKGLLAENHTGATFAFPPKHVSSLLSIILINYNNDGIDALNTKLCLFIYVIMDMSLRTLDNIEGPNGIQRIQEAFSFGKKFARYMNVEERMLDALTALWLLDCGVELTRAVGLLLRPNVQLEPSWPMSVIKALADHRVEASDAFKYYTALRPKLRTMDDALLIIRVFLQNNLWQHAFQEQRFICNGVSMDIASTTTINANGTGDGILSSNSSNVREDVWISGARPHDIGKTRIVLLSTIFDYFFQMSLVEDHTESTSSGLGINNHMLAKLIALPLTDREEQVLVQYLVQRYRTDVRELIYMTLLIHYYLKRNRVQEAICIEGALHTILASIGTDGTAILSRNEMKAQHVLLDEHLYTLPPPSVAQIRNAQEMARRRGWEYFEQM